MVARFVLRSTLRLHDAATAKAEVTVAFGHRFERTATGTTHARSATTATAVLVDEFGYSEAIVDRLPPDDPRPSDGMTTRPAHYETTDVRIDKIVVGGFENNVFILRDKQHRRRGADRRRERARTAARSVEGHRRARASSRPTATSITSRPSRRYATRASTSASRPQDAEMLPVVRLHDPRRRRHRSRRSAPAHDPHARPHARQHVLLARRPSGVVQRRHAVPGRRRQHHLRQVATSRTIIESVDRRLFTLPVETLVLPGHGTRHRRSAPSVRTSTNGSSAAGSHPLRPWGAFRTTLGAVTTFFVRSDIVTRLELSAVSFVT